MKHDADFTLQRERTRL